jgi:pimeloyl-ACP methyl ester carboxylesterase
VFARKTVGQIPDHLHEVILGLKRKPALIGHSFGGLLVQILAGRGLASATLGDPAGASGRPLRRSGLTNRFRAQSFATEGDHHDDVGRANERPAGAGAPRISEFTKGVSEDDLRVIAEHGYEGAASADQDQQTRAVGLFITDMLAASIGQDNGATMVATPFQ